MDLLGCNALVTGGGVRVGRAIALALARVGCDVALQFHRSAADAEATAAEIRGLGRRAVPLPADLSDPAACAAVVMRACEALGRLDVLVNSAAVFLPGGILDTTLEQWDTQLAINLRAPFLLSQAFARQHAAGPSERVGKIVNIADARVARPAPDHLAYRSSKAALVHMTQAMALELAPRVTVNAVAPGALLPPPGEGDEAFARRVRERIPLRRAGGVEAVTDAVLYLLREDFVTGVVLPVDGGEYL